MPHLQHYTGLKLSLRDWWMLSFVHGLLPVKFHGFLVIIEYHCAIYFQLYRPFIDWIYFLFHLMTQVHHHMCMELIKFVNRVSMLLPAIEEARPRCNSGIQVLCQLSRALDKAKDILQHCSESSKLYLVFILTQISIFSTDKLIISASPFKLSNCRNN